MVFQACPPSYYTITSITYHVHMCTTCGNPLAIVGSKCTQNIVSKFRPLSAACAYSLIDTGDKHWRYLVWYLCILVRHKNPPPAFSHLLCLFRESTQYSSTGLSLCSCFVWAIWTTNTGYNRASLAAQTAYHNNYMCMYVQREILFGLFVWLFC